MELRRKEEIELDELCIDWKKTIENDRMGEFGNGIEDVVEFDELEYIRREEEKINAKKSYCKKTLDLK